MAKKKKTIEVQKFGGEEHLGKVKMNGHEHEVESVETQSQTKLEHDTGTGRKVIIRTFTFKIDKKMFAMHVPTKQELFDSHVRGIETYLWKDGLIFAQEYEPRILFNKAKTHYTIFVTAVPSRSNVLNEKTQTLSEIIHG